MIAFVVVCEDRHCAPMISVHQTLVGATSRVEKHKADGEKYYEDIEWHQEAVENKRWLLYLRSFDDGPTIRIEEIEVEP